MKKPTQCKPTAEPPADEADESAALRAEAAALDTRPPLSFAEMLRRLMPGIKAAARRAEFRCFLSQHGGGSPARTNEALGKYQRHSFSEFQFTELAVSFDKWRAERLAAIRRVAGRKGAAVKKLKKAS